MKIRCVWEHNGGDTLLYAADLPGPTPEGIPKRPRWKRCGGRSPPFCVGRAATDRRGAGARRSRAPAGRVPRAPLGGARGRQSPLRGL